jgi:hypothetical protein
LLEQGSKINSKRFEHRKPISAQGASHWRIKTGPNRFNRSQCTEKATGLICHWRQVIAGSSIAAALIYAQALQGETSISLAY